LTVVGVLTGRGCGWTCTGGVGDRLRLVSVVEYVDRGVGAVSVLDVYLALGTVPEVDGLGDEGIVLGLDEVLEDVVEEGSLALAEVLAFACLVVRTGGCTGGGTGGCVTVLAGALGAGKR
jgi:hypothetical protein